MMPAQAAEQSKAPAINRLRALTPLDSAALHALAASSDNPQRYHAKREMVAEGAEITEGLLILDGWAARQRILVDGRRQLLDFLLPGDLIGVCDFARPVALSAVIAITEVTACVAPSSAVSPTLARAYALSRSHAEAQLAAQVTRIGRMNAQDRIVDLLLEILERLELAGLAANGRIPLPLTQEVLGDAIGLTAVHVNRTLQSLRREGLIEWKGRDLVVPQPDLLRRSIGRTVPRISLA